MYSLKFLVRLCIQNRRKLKADANLIQNMAMFMFNWYQLLAFYTSTNSILKFVLYETSNSKPESVCTKVGFFLDCRTVFQCHTGQLLALFFICDFPGNLPVLASSIDILK